jgi:hypothetical protein
MAKECPIVSHRYSTHNSFHNSFLSPLQGIMDGGLTLGLPDLAIVPNPHAHCAKSLCSLWGHGAHFIAHLEICSPKKI